jgi:hypothetical protein
LIIGTYKKTRFSTNHSAVFSPDHQTTGRNFAKRQCKTTVVDSSQLNFFCK